MQVHLRSAGSVDKVRFEFRLRCIFKFAIIRYGVSRWQSCRISEIGIARLFPTRTRSLTRETTTNIFLQKRRHVECLPKHSYEVPGSLGILRGKNLRKLNPYPGIHHEDHALIPLSQSRMYISIFDGRQKEHQSRSLLEKLSVRRKSEAR